MTPKDRRGTIASRWSVARPHPQSEHRSAIKHDHIMFAAGVALVVFVVALLWQFTRVQRSRVAEPVDVGSLGAFLPTGAEAAPFAPLEVPDVPQNSYVFGYSLNDVPYVAYLRWDRDSQQYHVVATVKLATSTSILRGTPTLTALPLGTGAPVAILARASQGASTDGVMVLVPKGESFAPATMVMEDGTEDVAHFLSGASVRHSDDVTFDDVDSDGDRDAVVTSTALDEQDQESRTVLVYVWKDDAFRYDKQLSWSLTVSSAVFPEPEVTPTSTDSPNLPLQ